MANKVFIYALLPLREKQRCHCAVVKLGGVSRPHEDMYVSDATHVIVSSSKTTNVCPKILGALASGKHIVSHRYLLESEKQGRFIDETDFVPRDFVQLRSSSVSGKMWTNTTALVFLDNVKKQAEFRTILRDGGAKIHTWSLRELKNKSFEDLKHIDKVFTELSFLSKPDFDTFMRNKSGSTKVVSYFYIFKYILTPSCREQRSMLDTQFDINNRELMSKLHPNNTNTSSSGNKRTASSTCNQSQAKRAKVAAATDHDCITLSGDEEEEVNKDNDDDEVQVLSQPDSAPRSVSRKIDVEFHSVPSLVGGVKCILDKAASRSPKAATAAAPIEIDLTSDGDSRPDSNNEEEEVTTVEVEKLPSRVLDPFSQYAVRPSGRLTITSTTSTTFETATSTTAETATSNTTTTANSIATTVPASVSTIVLERVENEEDSRSEGNSTSDSDEQDVSIQNQLDNSTQLETHLADVLKDSQNNEQGGQVEKEAVVSQESEPVSKEVVEPDQSQEQIRQEVVEPEQSQEQIRQEVVEPKESQEQIRQEVVEPEEISKEVVEPEKSREQISKEVVEPEKKEKKKGSKFKKPSDKRVTLKAFVERQKRTNECVDICNAISRTTRFDSHDEAKLRADFKDARGRLLSEELDESAMLVKVDVWDIGEGKRLTGSELFCCVEEFKSILSSRYFFRSKTMHALLAMVRNQDEEDKLESMAVHKIHELFQDLTFLHPPMDGRSRLFYRNMFDTKNNLWKFLLDILNKCCCDEDNDDDERALLVSLDMFVTVLQKDVAYWWKHQRKKDQFKPLVADMFDRESDIELQLNELAELYVIFVVRKPKAMKHMRRIVAVVALYLSNVDFAKKKSSLLAAKTSLKNTLAQCLADNIYKLGLSNRKLYYHVNLLRPSWLPALVLNSFVTNMTGIAHKPNMSDIVNNVLNTNMEKRRLQTTKLPRDTNLHVLCRLGSKIPLTQLISNNGDTKINAKNSLGQTPAHCAAQADHLGCMEALFKHQTCLDLSLKDDKGYTLLESAVANDSCQVAGYLLKALPAESVKSQEQTLPKLCRSKKMKSILSQHLEDSQQATSGVEVDTADLCCVVRDAEKYQLCVSLYLTKLMETFPVSVVAWTDLAGNRKNVFRDLGNGALKPYTKDTLKLDNDITLPIKQFEEEVNVCSNLYKSDCAKLEPHLRWKFGHKEENHT